DLPYVLAIDRDPEVQKTLFGQTYTAAESSARLMRWIDCWKKAGFGMWVFREHSGEAAGHAGLFPARTDNEIETGYIVRPEYWGRGYASEMCAAVLQVGFENLNLDVIIANAEPSNIASRRVMEKSGMSFDCEFLLEEKWPTVRYVIRRDTWKTK
ncbi:MAG: GNAT family N-acetyltransferase, partial [Candidatus Eremiobacteraeota bacterium]|nr:GNAT family N-acetyltransferase [Candidatus Eremiobacteraeota bacterium]